MLLGTLINAGVQAAAVVLIACMGMQYWVWSRYGQPDKHVRGWLGWIVALIAIATPVFAIGSGIQLPARHFFEAPAAWTASVVSAVVIFKVDKAQRRRIARVIRARKARERH